MSNIFGKPFRNFVTQQIQTRQESLGYKDYTVDDLKYQNSKTPWIRVASTANIKQYLKDNQTETKTYQNLLKNGLNPEVFLGDKAAKNFILQGGVIGLGQNNELITYQGLNSTNSYYNGAYGWGGIDEKGYVPMPGIIDASLIYKSDGAFAQGTINMKCFSRSQLALMDILYMRPGINLLLEFGWSTYLDNTTRELRTYNTFISPALDFTLNKNGVINQLPETISTEKSSYANESNQSTILGLIEQERIERSGNYEGIFGLISNFNWSFNKDDGSYDCQAKIIGHGDIIESLKVNVNEPTTKEEEGTKEATLIGPNPGNEAQVIAANIKRNRLFNILDFIYRNYKNAAANDLAPYDTSTYGYQDFLLPQFQGLYSTGKKDLRIKNGVIGFASGILSNPSKNNQPVQVFIKFSVLLAIIQKYFFLYDEQKTPLMYFDMNFQDLDNDENYISNLPGQFSANPFQCFTPYQNHNLKYEDAADEINKGTKVQVSKSLWNLFNLPDTSMNQIFTKAAPNYLSNKGHVGKLSDVFLNLQWIQSTVTSSTEFGPQTQSLKMIDFLKNILSGINTSRGSINDFRVVSDITKNSIKIEDRASIRFKSEFPPTSEGTELCMFNTFGVKNKQEGSIVKNVDINSTIDKSMEAVIAASLGDGSNGYQGNGTGLSKWSQGISNRIFPEVGDSKIEEGPYVKIARTWAYQMLGLDIKKIGENIAEGKNQLYIFNSILDDLKWITEDVETLVNANQTYASLLNGIMVTKDELRSPTFLPFNFSMDIEGISGIRIGERFDLDDNVLPNTYDKNALEMQTISCDHTVNNNSWTTKTTAYPLPALPPDAPFIEANPLVIDASKDQFEEVEGLDDQLVLTTITSQIPIRQIFKPSTTNKTQIYLHHTVSGQSIQSVIDSWNNRTDQVSTQYITNNNGEAEQVFPDENWANQLGIEARSFKVLGLNYQNLNKTALGIELCSYGGLTQVLRSKTGNDPGPLLTTYGNTFTGEWARPVGANGEYITYFKGYKYFEKYSDAQIAAVKNIVLGWMDKYQIEFEYNYNTLFPVYGRDFKPAYSAAKGLYTHNSVRRDKSDIFPQSELIEMLKSISTNMSDEALVLAEGGSYVATSLDQTPNRYSFDNSSALFRAKVSAQTQLVIAALGEEKAKNYQGLVPNMLPDPSINDNINYDTFYVNNRRDVDSNGNYLGYYCSGIFIPSGTQTSQFSSSTTTTTY